MYEFLEYRVKDVMTIDLVSVRPDTRLAEAEKIFEEHDFNSLPVLSKKGKLVGWFTKLDLLSAFCSDDEHMFPPYEEIMKQPVSRFMNREIRSVTPLAPLTRVIEKLVSRKCKSFPVVDSDDELVGVVAREDVLRGLRNAAEGVAAPVE
jgi:tRNA nucleotidyltransferase (CCA-adding enzyme)